MAISNNFTHKFDHLWRYLPQDFSSILDIGGGSGGLYFSLQKFTQRDIKYVLIDNSKEAINIAKKQGVVTVVHDIDKFALPFSDNSFELVVLSDVLEHLHNPWAVLKEAARISNKYVFIKGPNFASFKCRLDALRGNPIRDMVIDPRGSVVDVHGRRVSHIYYITYFNILYWAQKTGLSLVKSRVFWYKRYMPFRWVLEKFCKNLGSQYEILFYVTGDSQNDPNFKFIP